MGARSKRKGYRGEHELEQLLRIHGLNARRVPLSGAAPGTTGDMLIEGFEPAEVKYRESIGAYLWDWLEKASCLFLRRNGKSWLVVMRLDDWVELVKGEK